MADRTSKLHANGKKKEVVVYHEIIDVDMDDEDCKDIVLVEPRKKAKASMGISLVPCSSVKLELKESVKLEPKVLVKLEPKEFVKVEPKESVKLEPMESVKLEPKEVASNKKGKGFNPGSNNFVNLDDYVYDNDKAPVPQFQDPVPKKTVNPAVPFVASKVKLESSVSQPNRVDSMPTSTWFRDSVPKKTENPAAPSVSQPKWDYSSTTVNPSVPFAATKSNLEPNVSQPKRDYSSTTMNPSVSSVASKSKFESNVNKPKWDYSSTTVNPSVPFAASKSKLESTFSQPKWDYSYTTQNPSASFAASKSKFESTVSQPKWDYSYTTQNPSASFAASKSKFESTVSQPKWDYSYTTQNPSASFAASKSKFESTVSQPKWDYSYTTQNPSVSFAASKSKLESSVSQPKWDYSSTTVNSSVPFVSSKSKLESSVSQPKRDYSMPTSTSFSSSKTNTASAGQSTSFDFKHVLPQTAYSNFSGNGYPFSNSSNTESGYGYGYGTSSYPQSTMNTGYPLGTDATNSEWYKSTMKNHVKSNEVYLSGGKLSGTGGMYPMNDKILGQDATVNGPSSKNLSSVESKSSVAKLVVGDVQKRYKSFKKFDTVVDHSDHHFLNQNSAKNQAPKNWAKKIQEEWKILENDLPDTIFVRAYESRMDLLRAVIIGAEGTPYHDGLFFFDVCFPSDYPNTPPLVHYHSGGLRINPNLYNSGKVCLSLLNTWTGGQKERWLPGTSTMLQVLVSIQGLILNMKPYFNEPGYAHSSGSAHGEKASLQYNENTLILSLKTMVYTMNKPPKNFEDLVIGHFQHRLRDILMACKAYTEGVQVGCVVKGGVQDVDEDNISCSAQFKNDVGSYIKILVDAFKKIGAKKAEEFLFLSDTKNSLPSTPTPTIPPTPTS